MSELLELHDIDDATAFNLRRWEELLDDPYVRNYVGREDTDRFGRMIKIPPPGYDHGGYQSGIIDSFKRYLKTGRVTVETPISTSAGVRLADAVWASAEFLAGFPEKCGCLPSAPEICLEVVSLSNSRAELEEKRCLYFEAGAKEFWLCKDGKINFYLGGAEPPAERSVLCPEFPRVIEL
jgi:Uma2 family endonuclease